MGLCCGVDLKPMLWDQPEAPCCGINLKPIIGHWNEYHVFIYLVFNQALSFVLGHPWSIEPFPGINKNQIVGRAEIDLYLRFGNKQKLPETGMGLSPLILSQGHNSTCVKYKQISGSSSAEGSATTPLVWSSKNE